MMSKSLVQKHLRQADLEQLNISRSASQTKQLIDRYGFPPGIMLSPKIRGWAEDQVAAWLAQRPVMYELPPIPNRPRGRPRKQPAPEQNAA